MHRRGRSAVVVLKSFTENYQPAPVQRLAIRGTRARRLAVSSLIEPNKTLVSVSMRQIYKHYINRRARRDRLDRIGLAGLYPNHPDILVQHPCALSDDNNGATLTRAGVMRTHFPSNLQIGEADGRAPV